MKIVTAIINPSKLDAVRDELAAAGAPGITVTEVRGFGTRRDMRKRIEERQRRSSSIRRSNSRPQWMIPLSIRSSRQYAMSHTPDNPVTVRFLSHHWKG